MLLRLTLTLVGAAVAAAVVAFAESGGDTAESCCRPQDRCEVAYCCAIGTVLKEVMRASNHAVFAAIAVAELLPRRPSPTDAAAVTYARSAVDCR
jgi:hypothetical protein